MLPQAVKCSSRSPQSFRLNFRQQGFVSGNGVVPNGCVHHGERQCRPIEESFDSVVANHVDAEGGWRGQQADGADSARGHTSEAERLQEGEDDASERHEDFPRQLQGLGRLDFAPRGA